MPSKPRPTPPPRLSVWLLATLLAIGAGLLSAPAALADTYFPTRTDDPAPDGCTRHDCSLREAITKANNHGGPDKIVLQAGKTYKLRQPGAGELANQTGDLNIRGSLRILSSSRRRATVDANGIDRVFEVGPASPVSATFKYLKIRGGSVSGSSGGGIELDAGALNLVDTIVADSQAATVSGGGGYGGGIFLYGGSLRLVRSAVVDNSGGQQAGVSGGGIMVFTGADQAVISSSTVSGNAIGGAGGGIASLGNPLTMRNDTVANNHAKGNGGGIYSQGTTSLNNVTVARNIADSDTSGGDGGGGLYQATGGTFNIANSLVALNAMGTAEPNPDCDGVFTSGGHNLITTSSLPTSDPGCSGFGGADIFNPLPRIGQLAHNGGPTETVALLSGSPAINEGDRATAQKRDQRGFLRDSRPDIGAFESGAHR